MALPTYTRTIDNSFVSTWDKIRSAVMDNVIKSHPVWAYLRKVGCFKKQRGGLFINRTVKYALPTATAVARGTTLPMGEPAENKTMAQWTFRWMAAAVKRTIFDDQANSGEFQILDYRKERLSDADASLREKYETDLLRAEVTDESGMELQGLNDLVPAYANRATGTYGRLDRSNSWWQPKYRQLTGDPSLGLTADMRRLYNDIYKNQEAPNLLVSDQSLFETYEDNAEDKVQIVKGEGDFFADLGFESLYYKGKPWVWTENMTTANMLFLNTNYIDVVYDPMFFFALGDWITVAETEDKLARILCCMNLLSDQLRRHGRLYQ